MTFLNKAFRQLCLVPLLAFAPAVNTASAENLLRNPGFEEGENGWTRFVPGDSTGKNCRFSISTESPRTGHGCAEMKSDDFARYALDHRRVPVSSGKRYRASIWLRADSSAQTPPDNDGVLFRLSFAKGGTELPGKDAVLIGLNGKVSRFSTKGETNISGLNAPLPKEWTKVEGVFEIPPAVDGLNVDLFCWSTKGAIFLDDASLEEVAFDTPLSAKTAGQLTEGTTDAELLDGLDLDAQGLEKVKAAAEGGDWPTIKSAYLDFRRTGSSAKWKIAPEYQPAKAIMKEDAAAEDVCAHIIKSTSEFEPKVTDMGKDFAWQYNPIPKDNPQFSKEFTYCVISRMGFWENLANGYWKTRNEKYAKEWVAQLEDFTSKNPVGTRTDPSLWRTLDASLRISDSWPYCYFHFLRSPSFTPEAQWTYSKSMIDHARLLTAGLSLPRRSGNWVTAECFGLYTIGVLFPELKEAASWRKLAMDRLTEEFERQVPPDGFQSELTTGYHYYCLSSFVGPLKLAKLNHLPVPGAFHAKILSMYQAPVLMMDQSGNVVPTNDSGIDNAREKAREGLDLVGPDPLLEWAASNGAKGRQPADSTMLPYAGFYAMRSGWQPDDLFLFFRGGPTGSGHEHEDMLEIVLRAWKKTLLFDPGIAAYDHSQWRRFSVGTSSHNTIVVDEKWQHRGTSKVPVLKPANNPWVTTPMFDYAAATYDNGYQQNEYDPSRDFVPMKWVGDIDHSVSHTRRVLFLKPYYALVLDTVEGTGNHTIDAHFHMDAQSARVDAKTQAVFSQDTSGPSLALYPLETQNLAVDVVQGQKDPLLGWISQQRAIPTARFRKQQEAPAIFATFLYPYLGQEPAFSASGLKVEGTGLWQRGLLTSHEQMEIILARNELPQAMTISSQLLGTVQAKATGILFRKLLNKESVTMSGWGITAYRDKQWGFTSPTPVTLNWLETSDRLLVFNAGNHPIALTIEQPFQKTVELPPAAWTEITTNAAKKSAAPELLLQRQAR